MGKTFAKRVLCVHISKQGEDGGLLFRCSQQITHTVEKHSRGLIRWSIYICKKEDVFGVRVEFKGDTFHIRGLQVVSSFGRACTRVI